MASHGRDESRTAAIEKLAARRPLPGQCGIAVVHGRRVAGMDLFGAPQLLAAHWSALVRSHLLEAHRAEGSASATRVLKVVRGFAVAPAQESPGVGLGVEHRMADRRLVWSCPDAQGRPSCTRRSSPGSDKNVRGGFPQRRFDVHHKPSSRHQRLPAPSQITMFTTLIRAPSFHQSPMSTLPEPNRMGAGRRAVMGHRCETGLLKKARTRAASRGGVPTARASARKRCVHGADVGGVRCEEIVDVEVDQAQGKERGEPVSFSQHP